MEGRGRATENHQHAACAYQAGGDPARDVDAPGGDTRGPGQQNHRRREPRRDIIDEPIRAERPGGHVLIERQPGDPIRIAAAESPRHEAHEPDDLPEKESVDDLQDRRGVTGRLETGNENGRRQQPVEPPDERHFERVG